MTTPYSTDRIRNNLVVSGLATEEDVSHMLAWLAAMPGYVDRPIVDSLTLSERWVNFQNARLTLVSNFDESMINEPCQVRRQLMSLEDLKKYLEGRPFANASEDPTVGDSLAFQLGIPAPVIRIADTFTIGEPLLWRRVVANQEQWWVITTLMV